MDKKRKKTRIARCLDPLLRLRGLEVSAIQSNHKAWFESYLEKAAEANQDINDWLELSLGWENISPVLESLVYPRIKRNCTIFEIGPGTGRHTRKLLRPETKRIYLIDNCPLTRDFLERYFSSEERVVVLDQPAPYSLGGEGEKADLVFSNGTFIALKLGEISEYAKSISTILKPGGFFIFDYISLSRDEGWDYLFSRNADLASCYTYYPREAIEKTLLTYGLAVVEGMPFEKSWYSVFQLA